MSTRHDHHPLRLRRLVLFCVGSAFCVFGLRANDAALVIGAGPYSHYPVEQQLAYTQRDAGAVMATFQQVYSSQLKSNACVLITGTNATRKDIERAVEQLAERVRNPDVLHLYFSGHGAVDRFTHFVYLMGNDGEPANPRDGFKADDFLEFVVNAIRPKRLHVFIDACHAAAAVEDQFAERSRAAILSVEEKRRVTMLGIFAARKENRAYGDTQFGHSWFTYYFVRGLQGDADQDSDQQVSAAELLEYIQRQLAALPNLTDAQRQEQVPETTEKFEKKRVLSVVKGKYRVRAHGNALEQQTRILTPLNEWKVTPKSINSIAVSIGNNQAVIGREHVTASTYFKEKHGDLDFWDWKSGKERGVTLEKTVPVVLHFGQHGLIAGTAEVNGEGKDVMNNRVKLFQRETGGAEDKWQLRGPDGSEITQLHVSDRETFITNVRLWKTIYDHLWFEDSLQLRSETNGIGLWTNRYTADLVQANISADGSRIACAFRDNTIVLLSETGSRLALIDSPGAIKQVEFSPSNQLYWITTNALYRYQDGSNLLVRTGRFHNFVVNRQGDLWVQRNGDDDRVIQSLDSRGELLSEILLPKQTVSCFFNPEAIVVFGPNRAAGYFSTKSHLIEILKYP